MPTRLSQETCKACRADAPKVDDGSERQMLLDRLHDWQIIDHNGIDQLQRRFTFKNFAEAINFANQVGELAETANHHPAILVEWGAVTVTWWTHKIHGLHRNDFIMAARTEQLPVIIKD